MKKGALSRTAILGLMKASPPLIEGCLDPEVQAQPNGFDLTLRNARGFSGPGAVDFSNKRRVISPTEPVLFNKGDQVHLGPGAYMVTFNEVVNLPLDLMAIGRTRSSLLRCGVALHTAVWDAGYCGRSESLMEVYNPSGFVLMRDARIMQLVFFWLDEAADKGYSGKFLGENI